MVRSYKIVGGPSKFDLMISLMHGDCQNRQAVQFDLKPDQVLQPSPEIKILGLKMNFWINRIEREDGSGEKWNIVGYSQDGKLMKAFYETKGRTGGMEF